MKFAVWAVGAVCSYLVYCALTEWAQLMGMWSWPKVAATALAMLIVVALAAFGAAAVIGMVG